MMMLSGFSREVFAAVSSTLGRLIILRIQFFKVQNG
jgi:hypothetical protein